MKHQSKKIQFGNGQDADRMLMRKMCYNFLQSGRLTTTYPKAKAVKSMLDTLVARLDEQTEANKKYVSQIIQDKVLRRELFAQLGSVATEIRGGYITISRLHERSSDGAQMAQISWAHSIQFTPAGKSDTPVDIKEQPTQSSKKEAKQSIKQEDESQSEDTANASDADDSSSDKK